MSEWYDYRLECFGEPYYVWHDGADFTEIARRFKDDPDLVLTKIRLGIGENDDVAAQACRYLDPTEEQRPKVIALLEEMRGPAYGSTQTEIATSLHALGADSPDLSKDVVHMLLADYNHWGVKLDAARRLESFPPTAELVEALRTAMNDEDYLVRYHSANTLRHWAGQTGEISDDDELFGLIIDDAGAEKWAQAADRLAAAVPLPGVTA